MECAQDVLHEHAAAASQLDQPELLLHGVAQRVDAAESRVLQEDHQPGSYHFPEQARYLWRSGEVALLREHVLLAVVPPLLIRQGLLPVARHLQLSQLADLLDN